MAERILLLRSGEESDAYEDALKSEGFDVRSLAVLAFDFVNDERFRDALVRPRNYDGLVFTSPRAVDALVEAMPWLPTENVLWHNKPVFAVGRRTADTLRSLGFEPEGEDSGSAEKLADLICGRKFDRPLLFLCGNRRRDVFPARLREAGIQLEEICVYVSRYRSDIDWPVDRKPDWVVFFSPSGYEAVLQTQGVDLNGMCIAAIGPTTAGALRAVGLEVVAVADDPSPAALSAAIRSAAGE